VVERIETPDGRVIEAFEPKVMREVEILPEQKKIIVDALSAVVNEPGGTAFRSRLGEVEVAGKTGTAQVARLGATRLKKEQMSYWERDHAWFASFAPASDPEITVVSLNEHGGHGGSDAAPAAMAIIKKYFELKRLDGEAFGKEYVPPKPAPAVKVEPLMPPLNAPVEPGGTGLATKTPIAPPTQDTGAGINPVLKPAVASTPALPPPDVLAPAPIPGEPVEPTADVPGGP
jgi:penicillin-binding protein 2